MLELDLFLSRLRTSVFALACTAFFVNAPVQAKTAYVVQEISEVHGPLQSFVCDEGIRLDTRELTFVTLAPKFRVTLVNNQNRRYMEESLDDVTRKARWLPVFTDGRKVTIKAGESTMIAGLKATHYFCSCPSSNGKMIDVGEFWATKDVKMPPNILETCARLMAVPPQYGMPLRLISMRKWGGRVNRITYLDTSKVERKNVEASVWALPKGYKKVPDEVTLVLEEDGAGGVEDLPGFTYQHH